MTLEQQVKTARESSALFDLSQQYGLIAIEGPDCRPFLNNISTNTVTGLEDGKGNRNALLNKKSQIISLFDSFFIDDHLLLHMEHAFLKPALEHLEAMHFAEEVRIHREPAGILSLTGPAADRLLSSLTPSLSADKAPFAIHKAALAGRDVYLARRSYTGDPGWLILTWPDDRQPVLKALTDAGAPLYEEDVLDLLQFEAGELRFGKEFDSTTMLLELNLGERVYKLDKGCYPGQEVVARIVNRGKIPRKIVGMKAEDDRSLTPGSSILHEEKNIGVVRTASWSPSLQRHIAVCSLKSDFADDGSTFVFDIDGNKRTVGVRNLPLYRSPLIRSAAQEAYNKGMSHYHENDYGRARACFEEAISLMYDYTDAWEGLAMAVEKLGDLDEAIILNRKFAELDPNAVMARTNLSRLYMFKGYKERAEEEAGKAQAIEFRLKLRARTGGKAASAAEQKARQEQQKKEAQRKMAMFNQVLEMDADDEIANFGLGKLLLEAGNAEEAVSHLQKVVEQNRKYSAAWNLLAKAHYKAGDTAAARSALETGMKVAEEQGDLMPLQSMKKLKDSLD